MNTAVRIKADKIQVTLEDGFVKTLGGKRASRAAAVVVSISHYYSNGETRISHEFACRQDMDSALQYAKHEQTYRHFVRIIEVTEAI